MAARTSWMTTRRASGSKHRRLLIRAPSPLESLAFLLVEAALLAALFGLPTGLPLPFLTGFLGVFLLPALVASALTGPVASVLGGRLTLKRSLLLSVTAGAFSIPVAAVWRIIHLAAPGTLPAVATILLFLQGPILWFRHMTLFGVSNPSHLRSLPASLVGPLASCAAILLLFTPATIVYLEAGLFLLVGFLASALLLRAADRPIRREFGTSGVALIRPLLDHINERDPAATETLERFFAKFSAPVDLLVRLIVFRSEDGVKATVALPSVHPGPFASLGSSDLPRRLADRLGAAAGTVFVPHTPCNHDLDLPTTADFDRMASGTAQLLADLPEGSHDGPASALVGVGPAPFARAQILGPVALVIVTQAPAPTDDIDRSAVEPVAQMLETPGGPAIAFVDAHNSYVEDEGDLTYGSPAAEKLARDVEAAVRLAHSVARSGPVRIGVGVRDGYSLAETGIGPHGIRALVVDAAGTRTAYVLIDGNNLVLGFRAALLEGLRPLAVTAEILTTDNHIVHEVDGGTNPVGERYSVDALRREVRAAVETAIADLTPVWIASGQRRIPSVRVLRPGWTVRLLTSLGDTLSMFTNAFVMTYLLVLTSSLVLLLLFR
ncbi:MAG: DUF2070 family protein [Thermoplasmata archaeon]|nr:DUF2070 family protein [Thermoplasmata archaeon]